MDAIPSQEEIARLLADYQVELSSAGLAQFECYLHKLVHWNQRIRLTGLKDPRQMVRRLFGESLYLSRVVKLEGWLVDVGSGAGFPGLALKLVAPELRVTLVEARRRKCAFLREVARACGFSGVHVVGERFEDWRESREYPARADIVTTRAVDVSAELLEGVLELLARKGKAIFFTTRALAKVIGARGGPRWVWQGPVVIPSSSESVLLVGERNPVAV